MRKPNAVSKNAKRADDAIRELTGSTSSTAAAAARSQPSQPEGELAEQNAPAEPNEPIQMRFTPPKTDAPQPQQQPGEPDDGAPGAVDDGDQPHEPSEQGKPPQSSEDDYEHRFRSLHGKYNSETRRLREQNQRMEARLDQMTGLLAALQKQSESKPADPKPAAPAPAPAKLVTERELEEFGPELLDAAGRFARQQWEPELAQLKSKISELEGAVNKASSTAKSTQTTVQMNAREQMHAKLDAEIPNWREINRDDEFMSWLEEEDAMSGEPRRTLLLKAYERNDASRVLRFFRAFKAEHAAGSATVTDSPASTPASPGTGRVDPSRLVSPGRGRSAPRNGTQTQQIQWTPDAISAFYADVQRGKFKNNAEEKDRLERDIFAAQQDGRL